MAPLHQQNKTDPFYLTSQSLFPTATQQQHNTDTPYPITIGFVLPEVTSSGAGASKDERVTQPQRSLSTSAIKPRNTELVSQSTRKQSASTIPVQPVPKVDSFRYTKQLPEGIMRNQKVNWAHFHPTEPSVLACGMTNGNVSVVHVGSFNSSIVNGKMKLELSSGSEDEIEQLRWNVSNKQQTFQLI